MKTRERGSLYKQTMSKFWWMRIGFQGRVIFQSTRTADKRQAMEVLKAKRQELEAARGGYINLPGLEAKRTTVAELCEALLADYKVRERRSISPVTAHLNKVHDELGAMRDLRRSAARNMDRAGVSRHVAMQITRHKTEAMYRRYNIVNN
jgi:hypothetical protein